MINMVPGSPALEQSTASASLFVYTRLVSGSLKAKEDQQSSVCFMFLCS